ncbi:MAG: M23 family metallopeptidase, partial [Alphaproteobacteria bacterium]|nr:M23 family metallopeptidase [Alphaproteobacteria bacterium]
MTAPILPPSQLKGRATAQTAFDELGKRANSFSRPVALGFAMIGMFSLLMGYWLRNSYADKEVADNNNTAIVNADGTVTAASDNNAAPLGGIAPITKNTLAVSAPTTAPTVNTPTNKVITTKVGKNNSSINNAITAPIVDSGNPIANQLKKADLNQFLRKDTFGAALVRGGVSLGEAYLATIEARKIYPLASLGENQVVKLDFGRMSNNQQFLKQLSLRVGDTSQLSVRRLEDGNFKAELSNLAIDSTSKLYRFTYNGSLAQSAEAAGIPAEEATNMANLLGLDINLQTDIGQGDLIQMLVDESSNAKINDSVGGNLRVVLVSSKTGKDDAFFYYLSDDGTVGYYNSEGKSQRKMLITTPVEGTHIVTTSPFGMRYNPALGYTRAHRGIDFAAPIGTPVYAAGDGVVEFAGWQSGYGNFIVLRHKNGFSTAYAHLSRIAAA